MVQLSKCLIGCCFQEVSIFLVILTLECSHPLTDPSHLHGASGWQQHTVRLAVLRIESMTLLQRWGDEDTASTQEKRQSQRSIQVPLISPSTRKRSDCQVNSSYLFPSQKCLHLKAGSFFLSFLFFFHPYLLFKLNSSLLDIQAIFPSFLFNYYSLIYLPIYYIKSS